MAEIAQRQMELMLKELRDMKEIRLFPEDTIKIILKTRKEFENKVNNTFMKNLEDYKKYIEHELLLLKKVRRTRDKEKIVERKSSIDFSIIKRIKRLYGAALQRFSNDYSLNEEYFHFCKEHNFNTTAVVEDMIRNFSHKPEVWKLASRWYAFSCNDIIKALKVIQKGLTVHKNCPSLYTEAVEMELSVFKKDSTESNTFKENECCEKIKTYLNLITENINDMNYYIELLGILQSYRFTLSIQDTILHWFVENRGNEPIVWHTMAQRERKGIHFVTDPAEQPRSVNFTKSCLFYCISKYEQGLKQMSEDKKPILWSYYLECLVEIKEENTKEATATRADLLKQALTTASSQNYLTEKYYILWLELAKDDEALALKILKKATLTFPQSVDLWKLLLRYAIMKDSVSEVNKSFKQGVLALKEEALPLWLMTIRFHNLVSDGETIGRIFEDGVKEPAGVSEVLKPNYIEWLALDQNIEAARKKYFQLAVQQPYCKAMHFVMSKLESIELEVNFEAWEQVHKLACEQFGKVDLEVWINYIKFHLYKKGENMEECIKQICLEAERTLPSLLQTQFREMYGNLER